MVLRLLSVSSWYLVLLPFLSSVNSGCDCGVEFQWGNGAKMVGDHSVPSTMVWVKVSKYMYILNSLG